MPVVKATQSYNIVHDRKLPLVVVGNTIYSKWVADHFKCPQLTLEEAASKDQSWFDTHQLFSGGSNIKFKITVDQTLASYNPQYVSIVASNSVISDNVDLGYNVFVDNFAYLQHDIKIADHTSITYRSTIGHHTSIGKYCHISPNTSTNNTSISEGCFIGSHVWTFSAEKHLNVAAYSNVYAKSRILRSITQSGTYKDNKLISKKTSLELHI